MRSTTVEARVKTIEVALTTQARQSEEVQRLLSVPGIGLLTATALNASAGDPSHFRNGRHLAAWLGLTPIEHSSGDRRHLGAISKRGDGYVRMLLIHGARAVLNRVKQLARAGHVLNRLQRWAVALANKLARIAWAVWQRQTDYQPVNA